MIRMEGEGIMCRIVSMDTNFGTKCRVADIKKDYISNIIKNARICPDIDYIVLFGSALEDRCRDHSDIDIAVFGKKTEGRMLTSGKYRNFENAVYSFGDFQDYDVLYFKIGKNTGSDIMKDIKNGTLIYKREKDGAIAWIDKS